MKSFDIQVNGYGGIDYNKDGLTLDELRASCETLKKDGFVGILATIITEDLALMCQRLGNLVKHREADPMIRDMIPGFHIEGPFLNPKQGFRGAHPEDAMRPANLDDVKKLLDACDGLTRIVTLAPECDPGYKTTRYLADQGVTVSAGHCDPTVDELKAAIDAGLSMFTHLGNGCPMTMHRHDNIVQRALSLSEHLWLCFIADGVHVDFTALSNYIKLAGHDRCIVTTDAMSAAGLGPGRYTIARWEINVGEDLAARSHDGTHLLGSAMSMPRAIENLRTSLGYTDAQIEKLVHTNPLKAVNL